jgi:hypothetical protein
MDPPVGTTTHHTAPGASPTLPAGHEGKQKNKIKKLIRKAKEGGPKVIKY